MLYQICAEQYDWKQKGGENESSPPTEIINCHIHHLGAGNADGTGLPGVKMSNLVIRLPKAYGDKGISIWIK
jgi:hypothetical protein